ncbi:acyl-CoA dehydrogenase family protein [Nonomuraea sp. NPDC048892]|uniref:acyl-CoA dehydrogenase family protein n=1 Tax=Nonomuraea sp. NPDC048892 TaxID=3154624 RepID=UPI0033D722C9
MISDFSQSETHDILRAHAGKTEQDGRPAAESLDAVRRLGALRLRTPREYGGTWAGAQAIARALSDLGRACPSTAWVAGTSATAKNIIAGCFSDDAVLREVFADPDALFCGNGVPAAGGERVPEGVRVNGRWANLSGCEDAAWATLALMVDGRYSFAVIPVADLVIERTWHMAGMRGTGSHTLVAENVLVPAERVAATSPFGSGDLILYTMAVLGPVVGAARGALDTIDAMFASDRKPFMSAYAGMGESPGARHWLAEATLLVNRAERAMIAVAAAVDANGVPDGDLPRLHMELADAAQDCRAALDRMLDLHGASGFNTANPLQRYWRDVSVGSRHPHLNPYLGMENYGTALAGPQKSAG